MAMTLMRIAATHMINLARIGCSFKCVNDTRNLEVQLVLSRLGRLRVAGDEPGPALKREVRHRPLEQHHHPVAKSDEHENVQKQPREPREHPREPDPSEIADGRAPPDN